MFKPIYSCLCHDDEADKWRRNIQHSYKLKPNMYRIMICGGGVCSEGGGCRFAVDKCSLLLSAFIITMVNKCIMYGDAVLVIISCSLLFGTCKTHLLRRQRKTFSLGRSRLYLFLYTQLLLVACGL